MNTIAFSLRLCVSAVKNLIRKGAEAQRGIEDTHQCVFPNLRFENPIPEIGVTPQKSFEAAVKVNHVMSNSFGFFGELFIHNILQTMNTIAFSLRLCVSAVYNFYRRDAEKNANRLSA